MRTLFRIAPSIIISLVCALPAAAQTPLASAFDSAWQRQPAAAALSQRERAVQAQIGAATALTAAPPSVELATRSDRFNRNQGARENELGLILPLWLPGERSGAQAVAEAEREALGGRSEALRLRLAQLVRDNWWAWQASRNEAALADGRLAAATRLRDDVSRRFQAGDLSRADFNQAEGLLAQAQALRAEAGAFEAQARYRLQSLSGQPPASTDIEPEPLPASAVNVHPLLRELHARRDLARRGVELARAQNRANPELAVSTRRDRAGNGEPNEQTWALSLRIPFAGGPRHDARVATANADAIEADIELAREEERLQRETEAMRLQLEATRQQLTAAETRARLAADNRGFYEKSFRLGESDLPTRLRIEAEAFEAERALGRARIGLAQGISQLRQVLGLLPE